MKNSAAGTSHQHRRQRQSHGPGVQAQLLPAQAVFEQVLPDRRSPARASRISVMTVRLTNGSPTERLQRRKLDPLPAPSGQSPRCRTRISRGTRCTRCPFAQPSIGTKPKARAAAAPQPFDDGRSRSAQSRTSRTMPPTLKRGDALLQAAFVGAGRFACPVAMETSASSVITPKPPIWMAAISTTCPKSDQCVPGVDQRLTPLQTYRPRSSR